MLPLYSAAIFLSAFLLFLVEPLLGRMILPMFGGAPLVWTTMLAFFQTTLLLGYVYVFASSRWLGPRRQISLHVLLLLLPLGFLPILVARGMAPPEAVNPASYLLGLLSRVVAVPFFVISASSPLLQRWFSALRHPRAADPYFLYVASNAGSLGGLVCYPLLLEPLLTLHDQSQAWSVGYGVMLAVMLPAAFFAWRDAGHSTPAPAHPNHAAPLLWGTRLRWLLLALVPSGLLASVTTYVTTDMASIPLWWVVPLILYLVSLMLAFAEPSVWNARRGLLLLAYTLPVVAAAVGKSHDNVMVGVNLIVYFLALMLCHGELARVRPPVAHLSEYYVWMAAGGAVGSLLCAVAAPWLFNEVVEYPLCLLAVACIALGQDGEGRRDVLWALGAGAAISAAAALITHTHAMEAKPLLMLCVGGSLAFWLIRRRDKIPRVCFGFTATLLVVTAGGAPDPDLLHTTRSFFGTYRIGALKDGHFHYELSGTTLHGMQSTVPSEARTPLMYYYPSGPAGQVMQVLASLPPRPVAVVGLGAGAMACYAHPGEDWTFYELDGTVEALARDPRYFTFLRDCPARVVIGDARLSLVNTASQSFGTLVLDAYGSDAIPVHLLTREAMALYLAKLAPGGVLLFHVSNLHYDLPAVVGRLASAAGLVMLERLDADVEPAESDAGKFASQWLLLARNAADLAPFAKLPGWHVAQPGDAAQAWTDDFSSVVSVLRWN